MNHINDVNDKFSKMLVSKNTIDDSNSFQPPEKPSSKSKNSEVTVFLFNYRKKLKKIEKGCYICSRKRNRNRNFWCFIFGIEFSKKSIVFQL